MKSSNEQQALPNRLSSHKIDCLNDLKSKQEHNNYIQTISDEFFLRAIKTVRQQIKVCVRVLRMAGRAGFMEAHADIKSKYYAELFSFTPFSLNHFRFYFSGSAAISRRRQYHHQFFPLFLSA